MFYLSEDISLCRSARNFEWYPRGLRFCHTDSQGLIILHAVHWLCTWHCVYSKSALRLNLDKFCGSRQNFLAHFCATIPMLLLVAYCNTLVNKHVLYIKHFASVQLLEYSQFFMPAWMGQWIPQRMWTKQIFQHNAPCCDIKWRKLYPVFLKCILALQGLFRGSILTFVQILKIQLSCVAFPGRWHLLISCCPFSKHPVLGTSNCKTAIPNCTGKNYSPQSVATWFKCKS